MGRMDIDYAVLEDAFLRYQTKPRLSQHGDLYYEARVCGGGVVALGLSCLVLFIRQAGSAGRFSFTLNLPPPSRYPLSALRYLSAGQGV